MMTHSEKLRDRYNDVELDSFMKLLNIKPNVQWTENNTHHYKMGVHTYEDDSQQLDPYYHLIAEVERKHMEKKQVLNFDLEVKSNSMSIQRRSQFSQIQCRSKEEAR